MGAVDSAIHTQGWNPETEAERSAVRQQLERILAHPIFRNSKRYPAFLGYVVEQALLGHTEQLKERTIGIEVFNCDLDYDTSNSAIVRVTALEVRRRLAQYYHEPGHDYEIRITLHTGSYIPVFVLPAAVAENSAALHLIKHEEAQESTEPAVEVSAAVEQPQVLEPTLAHTSAESRLSRRWIIVAAIIAVIAAASVLGYRRAITPAADRTAFEEFWGQIVDAHGAVRLCMGTWVDQTQTAPGMPIGMDYVHGVERITRLLEEHRKPYLSEARVLAPGEGEFDKFLDDGPVIYIGGYAPAEKMLAGGRYSFLIQPDGTHTVWVLDKQDPSRRQWRTEKNISVDRRSESYAILARVIDRTLGRPVVIVTGISFGAAQAATEVLLNPEYMKNFLQNAPADWKEMNMEAVIETHVVDLKYTPPQIVATHFWK